MPFLAQRHVPIPTKDIISWTFSDLKYDWDKPIYIDALHPENSISARQAYDLIQRLAAGFHALGLRKGDCICINSFNSIYYPIFFLGTLAAGCVFTGVNPAYTPNELAHTLKIAKVRCILAAPEMLLATLKAAETFGLPKDKIIIFNPGTPDVSPPPGHLQWADILSHGHAIPHTFDTHDLATTTPAARLFSSGTTGLPKAADLSHHNLIAEHTLVFEANPRPWLARRLLALPLFHAASVPSAFTSILREGSQAYVLPRFEPVNWFWALEKYGITDLALVPPLAVMAISSPLKDKHSLKSIRVANCGAAPLDRGPQAEMQKLTGGAPLTQVWGMTETSCIAMMFPYHEEDTTGSVGRPLPNMDVKLVDDDGNDVSKPGARGELCVRGPLVVRGYFENREANARDWDEDGYFHTGDIAHVDAKTSLWYIVDRKKELIKVRAFQVAPPELEGALLDHPAIIDAAVIGVPNPASPHAGELPRAYIVKGPGAKLGEPEVQTFMKEKLAGYKQLLGGVVFTDAIPKNASGKILKRLLREQAAKEMGAKL